MSTKTQTPSKASKFVPVTDTEASDYSQQFSEWLRTNVGPEAEKAYGNIRWLFLNAQYGSTEKGQGEIVKSRNQLNKFFNSKK